MGDLGCPHLLRVVQAPSPVDHHIRLLVIEPDGSTDGAGRVQLAELEKPIENGAVFADVKALQLSVVVLLHQA